MININIFIKIKAITHFYNNKIINNYINYNYIYNR